MSLDDRAFIQRATRIGIVALVTAVALFFLMRVLRSVLTPLVVSVVLAYLLDPVIDWFEMKQPEDRGRWARRIPRFNRTLSIFIFLVLVVLGLVALLVVIVPLLGNQFGTLAQNIPHYIETVKTGLEPLFARLPLDGLPTNLDEGLRRLKELVQNVSTGTVKAMTQQAGSIFSSLVGVVMYFVIVPLITYYFLRDFDTLKMRVFNLIPPRHQPRMRTYIREADQLIGAFIRGQLTIAFILGMLYSIGFTLVGLDLAFLIGMICGAGFIVPYLGTAIGIVLGSGMALLQYGADVHLLLVWGVIAVVQIFEGALITPTIMGNTLKLHPVTVVVALIIGGELLGILGMLIAIPIAAILSILLRDGLDWYRASEFYTGPGSPPPEERDRP